MPSLPKPLVSFQSIVMHISIAAIDNASKKKTHLGHHQTKAGKQCPKLPKESWDFLVHWDPTRFFCTIVLLQLHLPCSKSKPLDERHEWPLIHVSKELV